MREQFILGVICAVSAVALMWSSLRLMSMDGLRLGVRVFGALLLIGAGFAIAAFAGSLFKSAGVA